ncbi:MAG: Holliday junction branch migration protein RuvA [Demequinaceae bacterium]|nr:Holliday junction branch migration protein RuvA [Demequinaceae bacterium]
MFAHLTGKAVAVTASSLVVDVGGVGFTVLTTPSTLAEVREGEGVTVHTHLVVREDSLTVYGFSTASERDAFVALQAVTGVGPRLALAMLAVHSPSTLASAVATGDRAAFERVPGVGPKVAARLLLELAGRIPEGGTAETRLASDGREQVVEALVGLGWNARDSRLAVEAVAPGPIAADEVSGILRAALVRLGGDRG